MRMKIVSKAVRDQNGGSRLRLKFYLDRKASYVHRCGGCESRCKIDAVVLKDGVVIPKAPLVERVRAELQGSRTIVDVGVADDCLLEVVLEEAADTRAEEIARRVAKVARDEIDAIVRVYKELEALGDFTVPLLPKPEHHARRDK